MPAAVLRPGSVDVDAGVTWLDLTRAAFKEGLTPPVLTGYLDLSVGGTLSRGGISSTPRAGLQIDHVHELEVVTGTGRVERCSPTHNEDLFDAVLGGLGQFGIITRATIELVPAHERVRTYAIAYPDNATFFADLRELLHRDELEELWGQWLPTEQGLAYHLMAAQPFDPATPPDDDSLLRGLRETIDWDDLVKPWFDVWLPGTNVEAYVGDVIPTLTHRDVGPGGWVSLFPLHRPALTRTMARMPEPDVVRRKRQYDPERILTPGFGIWG